MNALAFEMSTRKGSVALFVEERLAGLQEWNDEGARSQTLFDLLPPLLEQAGLSIKDIGLFLVGRGPGSYTGLRVAITAAQALALPLKARVRALNSGAALAAELFAKTSARHVAMIGDARRERLWAGVFQREGLAQVVDWMLIPAAELAARLPAGTAAASPDWSRLAAQGIVAQTPGVEWLQDDRFPSAEWLGRAELERMGKGGESEALTPIYMHPPVFIPPQFPVRDP